MVQPTKYLLNHQVKVFLKAHMNEHTSKDLLVTHSPHPQNNFTQGYYLLYARHILLNVRT